MASWARCAGTGVRMTRASMSMPFWTSFFLPAVGIVFEASSDRFRNFLAGNGTVIVLIQGSIDLQDFVLGDLSILVRIDSPKQRLVWGKMPVGSRKPAIVDTSCEVAANWSMMSLAMEM